MKYLQEYPVHLIHELPKHTGHEGCSILVILMEYGHNFSGPGEDVFRAERSSSNPSEAEESNFLHPVLYYYSKLPTGKTIILHFSKFHPFSVKGVHHLQNFFFKFLILH